MNGHTEMPTIAFEEGADYDTLDSMIKDWAVRIWFKQGAVLTAIWLGAATEANLTDLRVWSRKDGEYSVLLSVPTDDIVKVSVI